MKTNILLITILLCGFCSNGQDLTAKDFESFYKVLVFQTDQAINAEQYNYVTVYENSFRFVRQHPLNDSIDNANPDMYFSAIQMNKDNQDLFPGFVVQLDEEPEEQMGYVLHHLEIDGDQFNNIPVSTPGLKTIQDFELFLTDMIENEYYMLAEDYSALMEIKKKLETVGTKYSPKVVQPINNNRVKIVDPVKIKPYIRATPINKKYKVIEKKN